MSSFSDYRSHRKAHKQTSPSPTYSPNDSIEPLSYKSASESVHPHSQTNPEHIHSSSSSIHSGGMPPIYTIDYTQNTAAVITEPKGNFSGGSPISAQHPPRSNSPNMSFSNMPLAAPTRWKRVRLQVMKMATVGRLQILWGLLALFGTMSWISLMPAFAFRVKVDPINFKAPAYTFFLIATVCTSLSALWQSLCPYLVRQSQRALLPRIINHPSTQTATIIISILLTIFNFFSWIILAADKTYGAKTNCSLGPLSDKDGYLAQCRGVNVAIVFDVVVFLLWIPISVVIICGTVERGLWWWGEDDGWAQGEIVGGSNMMSEEEFDMKIGLGGKRIKRRQTVHPENLIQDSQQEMVMIQQPKPAFVTPIASQFRSTSGFNMDGESNNNDSDDDFTNFSPSSYRKHQQQRQRQQQQQQMERRLNRRGSNTSLSSRLSSFFGSGWATGSMPDAQEQPPMPAMPSQYRQEAAAAAMNSTNGSRTNISGQIRTGSPGSVNTSGPIKTPNTSGQIKTPISSNQMRTQSASRKQSQSQNQNGNSSDSGSTNSREPKQPGMRKKEPNQQKSRLQKEPEPEETDDAELHGAEYTSQWHSRRYDDWS